MALNGSGPISLAGATAGQSIAVELGLSSTGEISLNQANVRTLAGVPSGAIIMPTNFYGKANFTPGNQTYTSSGTFAIPAGTTTLQIEVWGGGGAGGSAPFGGTYPPSTNNTAGGSSSCNGLTANGGGLGGNNNYQTFASGGSGGSASGGTTNTTGGAGASGANENCNTDPKGQYYGLGGVGGIGANGGTAVTSICTNFNGTNANARASGGSGATGVTSNGGAGGGGGGYSSRSFTGVSGSLSFTVGAKGLKGTFSAGPPGSKTIQGYGAINGGDGFVGAVKFTWT